MTEPKLTPGTWSIDPAHSEISFTVRHMMVSRVRGRFDTFDATLTVPDDVTQSSVRATIDAASISTNQADRDAHIRSADFFDAENHPEFTFVSTGLRPDGDDFVTTGELTIKGKTNTVELKSEFNGQTVDPWGNDRVGFHATTEINRSDFGVDIQLPMDGGGVVVGEKIKIELDAEFTRNA